MKPLGFIDYINFQINVFCVVSDSGTITEESSILGFPTVTIRKVHERPEKMDEGTLIRSGLDSERIINSIDVVVGQVQEDKDYTIRIVNDYGIDNGSKKIVHVILSYTDYINRTV